MARVIRMLTPIVITVVAMALVLMTALYLMQSRLVFHPIAELALTPDEIGLTFEDVRIPVSSTESIHSWYFPADSASATILFCHGNAGNISHRLETAAFLVAQGYNALLFDYRGYGQSDGEPTEENLYQDATAAYEWLVNVKRLKPEQIVIFGRSLGGAVAVDLAARVTCRALVLESTFSSATDMARELFPLLPMHWLLRYRFDSMAKIGSVETPVLSVHSPGDEIVPFAYGRALFDAANEPKRFLEISGGHNERDYLADPRYQAALREVIAGD